MFSQNLVEYRYRTGFKETEKRYGIKTHWHPETGYYQTDIDDFKKFFDIISPGNTEVTKLILINKKGVYVWTPERKWKYFGK